jgi:glycosyltransferase involved in cell wall biosynthesis
MLVSAIVPTYNRAHIIGKTIESIMKQSYSDIELIIIDDGSTDNTEQAIQKYIIKNPSIKYYYQKINRGCACARNKGIDMASGEYVAFLDSDDQWLPEAIDSMMKKILRTGADFVYSPSIEVMKSNFEYITYPAAADQPHLFSREHFLTNQARSCSILYNRYIFNNLRFDENLRHNEDSDLLQRVALKYRGAYSPQPTAKVFQHGSNKSSNRVMIYQALLESSMNILDEFPDFTKSLGENALKRIIRIKTLLIIELLRKNNITEALSISKGIINKLPLDLRLSLLLGRTFPFLITEAVKNIGIFIIHIPTIFKKLALRFIFPRY